jgi:hypothetical protein
MTKNASDDWRLLNLSDGSLGSRWNPFVWFRNLLNVRRRLRELDAVAAAVSRCEVILAESAPPAPESRVETTRTGFAYRIEGRPKRLSARGRSYPSFSGQFDFISRDPRAESPAGEVTPIDPAAGAKKSGPPRDLLLSLVREEEALQRYLDAANHDPARALVNAKGDVAYLDRLRSSGRLKFKPPDAFSKVLVPILIVLITAGSANVVGVRLQSRSLQENRKFEANLERLRESQRLAGSLYAATVDFRLRTASQETRDSKVGDIAIPTLEGFREQLVQVRNMIYGRANKDINDAWGDAEKQINRGRECFKKELENSKPSSPLCADQFDDKPFLKLQDTISLALVQNLD